MGCSPWGRKELGTPEQLTLFFLVICTCYIFIMSVHQSSEQYEGYRAPEHQIKTAPSKSLNLRLKMKQLKPNEV